jgi:uncharacterized membrane protein (UPF0127 family)
MAQNVNRRPLQLAVWVLVPLAIAAVVLIACGRVIKSSSSGNIADVKLDGKTFHLELAVDPDVRTKGLGGRDKIADDGGMLFVFPQPMTTAFVMRDCPIPIDIIFLDGSSRIIAMHKMVAEAPRGPDEQNPPGQSYNEKYEERLKKYPSKFATQFVIELKGNTLDSLKLKEGQKIDLDTVELKKRAK